MITFHNREISIFLKFCYFLFISLEWSVGLYTSMLHDTRHLDVRLLIIWIDIYWFLHLYFPIWHISVHVDPKKASFRFKATVFIYTKFTLIRWVFEMIINLRQSRSYLYNICHIFNQCRIYTCIYTQKKQSMSNKACQIRQLVRFY